MDLSCCHAAGPLHLADMHFRHCSHHNTGEVRVTLFPRSAACSGQLKIQGGEVTSHPLPADEICEVYDPGVTNLQHVLQCLAPGRGATQAKGIVDQTEPGDGGTCMPACKAMLCQVLSRALFLQQRHGRKLCRPASTL